MNGRYWVEKALKEATKDKAKAGEILAQYFDDAIDHVIAETEEASKSMLAELETLRSRISDESVESFIRELRPNCDDDETYTIIAGNIRNFVSHLRKKRDAD
jgi:hypothetical protein